MGSYFSIEIPDGSVLGSKRINEYRKKFELAVAKVEKNNVNKNPTLKNLFDLQERNAWLQNLIKEIRSMNSSDKLDKDILKKLEDMLKKYQAETQKMSDKFGSKNSKNKRKTSRERKELKELKERKEPKEPNDSEIKRKRGRPKKEK